MVVSFLKPTLPETAKPKREVSFTEFTTLVNQGAVDTVRINQLDSSIDAQLKNKERVHTLALMYPEFVPQLQAKGVNIKVESPNQNWLWTLFNSIGNSLSVVCRIMVFIFFVRAQSANNQAMSFGRSKAKEWSKDGNVKTTF